MTDIFRDVFDKSEGQKKVTFQQKKPILNYELNLSQDIQKGETEDFNKFGLGSNYFGDSFRVVQGDLNNQVKIKKGVFYDKGQKIDLTADKLVSVPVAPGSGTRSDIFYMEWAYVQEPLPADPAIGFVTTYIDKIEFEFLTAEGGLPTASNESITFSGNTITLSQGSFPAWMRVDGASFVTNSTLNPGSPSFTVTTSPDEQTIQVEESFVGETLDNVTFSEYDPSGDVPKFFKAYRKNIVQLAQLNRTNGVSAVTDIEDLRDKEVYNYITSGFEVSEVSGLDISVSEGDGYHANEEVSQLSAQPLTLTDNAINYVYYTAAGVASVSTTQPVDFHVILAEVRTLSGSIVSLSDERKFVPITWGNKKFTSLSDGQIAGLEGHARTVLDPEVIPPSDDNRYLTQSKEFAVSEVKSITVSGTATSVELDSDIDGAIFLGIETDPETALKYFDILSTDERRPALYTNSSDQQVEILGIYKDAGLTVPINPSSDTIRDAASTGFWEGGPLYFEINGIIDTDYRISYLKRYDMKDIPVDAMARGATIGGGGTATPDLDIIVSGGTQATLLKTDETGQDGTTVEFFSLTYDFGSDNVFFFRNGVLMEEVTSFTDTKASEYQQVDESPSDSNEILLSSTFPASTNERFTMVVFETNNPADEIVGTTGVIGTPADMIQDTVVVPASGATTVTFNETWDNASVDTLMVYRNGVFMRRLTTAFTGVDANVYQTVDNGNSSNQISLDPAFPTSSGETFQFVYLEPNIPTTAVDVLTGDPLEYQVSVATGQTGDEISFVTSASLNNTALIYRNGLLMRRVSDPDASDDGNAYREIALGSEYFGISLDTDFPAVADDVFVRIEFIPNNPTISLGNNDWSLGGNILNAPSQMGSTNNVDVQFIKNNDIYLEFTDLNIEEFPGVFIDIPAIKANRPITAQLNSVGYFGYMSTGLDVDEPEVIFGAAEVPSSGGVLFEGGSYLNRDAVANTYFSGGSCTVTDGGSYRGGNAVLEGRSFNDEDGPINGSCTPGDVLIRTENAFSSLGDDIDGGSINLIAGDGVNAGSKGSINFVCGNMDFSGVISVTNWPGPGGTTTWASLGNLDTDIVPDGIPRNIGNPGQNISKLYVNDIDAFGTLDLRQAVVLGASVNTPFDAGVSTALDTRESSLLSKTVAGGGITNLTLSNATNGTNFTLYIENIGGSAETVNLNITGFTLKWPGGTAVTNVSPNSVTSFTVVCTTDLSVDTALVTAIDNFS